MKSDERSAYLARVEAAAKDILSGELEILEGCRLIAELSWDLDQRESKLFSTFIAVDSETEHLPQPGARHLWSQEALVSKDAELARYLERSRDDILAACRQLIEALRGANAGLPERDAESPA